MKPPRILIAYGSHHGQTEKIARRIATRLDRAGAVVTLGSVDHLQHDLAPRDFAGAMVGSPIEFGRHLPSVRRFVRERYPALNAMPSAFFSVSGSAASPRAEERDAARRCIDTFLRRTGWTPRLTASFAGAMSYTRYNPFMRRVLAWISRREGGPTDTSRDHELTDWDAVERFAMEFMVLVEGADAIPLPLPQPTQPAHRPSRSSA